MWLTFVVGFFAVLPAALAERAMGELHSVFSFPWNSLIRAFLIAGLLEETTKAGVMALFFSLQARADKKWVTRPVDLMIYTITAGIGFAVFENMLYSFGGTGTILLRGVTALPLHVIASGILGLGLGRVLIGQKSISRGNVETDSHAVLQAHRLPKHTDHPEKTVRHTQGAGTIIPWGLGAVLLHGLYNFLLFTGGIWAFLTVPVLISGGILLFRLYILHSGVDTDVTGED